MSNSTGKTLTVVDLGRTHYDDALRIQHKLLEAVHSGDATDTLLFAEHHPVVTWGRATGEREVPDADLLETQGIQVREATRGGKLTYHGPGQLVGYPVCSIRRLGVDLHQYIAGVEAALVCALGEFGVAARSRPGLRGVWVENRKIASIGLAVRHWISYHGFAVNVCAQLAPFGLFTPCGIDGVEMTNVTDETESPVTLSDIGKGIATAFAKQLGYAQVKRGCVGDIVDATQPAVTGECRHMLKGA